jgi:hypothetical protein
MLPKIELEKEQNAKTRASVVGASQISALDALASSYRFLKLQVHHRCMSSKIHTLPRNQLEKEQNAKKKVLGVFAICS